MLCAESLEGQENALEVVSRQAVSGVRDDDADLANTLFPAGDRNGPAAAVVLDGVGDQVHQDLRESLPVGLGREASVAAVPDDRDRALGREGGHELACLFDQRKNRDRLEGEAEAARLDAGDVDELVNEGEQMASGAEDPLHAVAVFFAEVGQLK